MIIVFEGMPGSGKTTQIELLKKYLETKGCKVIVSEAGKDNKLTDSVKKAALNLGFDSPERAFMFWIARLLQAIFLEKKFLELARKHGWQIVNANRGTAKVEKDIRKIISSKFI